MTSTRRAPPLEIFRDPSSSRDNFDTTSSRTPRLQPSALPLEPLSYSTTSREPVLDAPSSPPSQPSPTKARRFSTPTQADYPDYNFMPIPPPSLDMSFTDDLVKNNDFPQPQPIPPMTQQPLFTTFEGFTSDMAGKENYKPVATSNDHFAEFPDPSYGVKAPLKRTLMEPAPLKERNVKKPKLQEPIPTVLPEPEDMPMVDDDGSKPPYSYAGLIGMAILRAPNRRLTLAQIYKWISESFSYYRVGDSGWQNSIRHNLSLNKAFIKRERPKDDPGKGNYWAIEPGMEHQFVKDKQPRRGTVSGINISSQGTKKDSSQPFSDSMTASTWTIPPPAPAAAAPLSVSAPALPDLPALPNLSSDATLPASDPALQDEEADEFLKQMNSQEIMSSPPQAINSSPPIAAAKRRRQASPAVATFSQPSSGPRRSKKRKVTAMDDSGYFSSLDSSVMKPSKGGIVLTSELDVDQPRPIRGRAEEEIARIRSGSLSRDDSPRRPVFTRSATADMLSSSPLRPDTSLMLPPTTPAIFIKKPTRPPPSVSPNTNLRNHRKRVQELINSPLHSVGLFGEDLNWSPAIYMLDTRSVTHDKYDTQFDIFADSVLTNPGTPAFSPIKRSAKRPVAGRTNSASVLADITGSNTTKLGKTPSLKPPQFTARAASISPSKSNNVDPYLLPQEDLFDFGLFADENSDSGDGFDIAQGFEKIGVHINKEPKSARKNARPALGSRSMTSRF